MSETQLPETINGAEAADVTQDAARPPIVPPEHRDEAADKINIHVTNNTVTPTIERVNTPIHPPTTAASNEGLETVATEPMMAQAVQEAPAAKPAIHAAEPPKEVAAPAATQGAPSIVTPEEFAQAEKNLAEYCGQLLSPELAKGLTLSLVNTANGGIEIILKGPMIAPNFAEFVRQMDPLGQHPAFSGIATAVPMKLGGENHDEWRQVTGDITPEHYAGIIRSLASTVPAIPSAAPAHAESTVHTDAQPAADPKDPTTGTTHQLPGVEKPTDGTVFETPKGVGKAEADVAIAPAVAEPASQTIPLAPAAVTPDTAEQAAVKETKTIPLGAVAETRVETPAQKQGKLIDISPDQEQSAVRA